MNVNALFKSYFLKFAIPAVIFALVLENAFTSTSYLGSKLSTKVMAGSAQRYLQERGGTREGSRGRDYFNQLNFNIYSGEEGKNLKLKHFMTKHVTSYEPAIFLGLVDDWQAVQKWDLQGQGEDMMKDAFGEELVQVLNITASTHSYYWKSTKIDYLEIGNILDNMKNQKDFSKIYQTRSNKASGHGAQTFVVLDQEIPEKLQLDASEPKVTAQLLDLNQTSMNIYSKGSKSVTQSPTKDILSCTASGYQQIAVVSAWEYSKMRVGQQFPEGGFLPPKYSPVDLFDEEFKDAKVHIVTLHPGDCIYIPSHWWHQILSAQDQPTIAVNYWYESSSSWADLMMKGISTNTV